MLRVPRTTTHLAKCRRRLSKYLVNVRKGGVTESEDEIKLMEDLVSRYSVPTAPLHAITQSNSTDKASETGHGGNDEPSGERIVRLPYCTPAAVSGYLLAPCLQISSACQSDKGANGPTAPYRCDRCPGRTHSPSPSLDHFRLSDNLPSPRFLSPRRPRTRLQIARSAG